MQVKTIRHMGITVKDLDRMMAFYQKIGLTVDDDHIEGGEYLDKLLGLKDSKARIVTLSTSDGFVLEFVKFLSHNKRRRDAPRVLLHGFSHLSFSVDKLPEDLGITSPYSNCKVVFTQDPEGNQIELVEEL